MDDERPILLTLESLLGRQRPGEGGPKLPGKAGLVISTVNWRGNRLLVQEDTRLQLASGNWEPALAVKTSSASQPPIAEARLR